MQTENDNVNHDKGGKEAKQYVVRGNVFYVPLGRNFFPWLREKRVKKIYQVVKKVLPVVRGRVALLKQIRGIDQENYSILLKRMVAHEARVELQNVKERNLENQVLMSLFVPFGVMLLVVPYFVLERFGVWYGWLGFLGFLYASTILFLVLAMLVVAPIIISSSYYQNNTLTKLFGLFWFAFGLGSYGYGIYYFYPLLKDSQVSWYLLTAASAVVQVFIYVVGAILLGLVTISLLKIMSIRKTRYSPDSLFVNKIFNALEKIMDSNKSWADLRLKNELMMEIEGAARVIGERVPKVLTTGDPYTDAWVNRHCSEVAESLREKKIWICMPKSDTKAQLEMSLSRLLISAVLGNWDELERAENKQPLRQGIKIRLRSFMLGLVVAFLPAAVFTIAQKVGILASGTLSDYLGFGVVLWALIAIVLAVDPRFGDKVEAFEKITSGIPGLLKKGK